MIHKIQKIFCVLKLLWSILFLHALVTAGIDVNSTQLLLASSSNVHQIEKEVTSLGKDGVNAKSSNLALGGLGYNNNPLLPLFLLLGNKGLNDLNFNTLLPLLLMLASNTNNLNNIQSLLPFLLMKNSKKLNLPGLGYGLSLGNLGFNGLGLGSVNPISLILLSNLLNKKVDKNDKDNADNKPYQALSHTYKYLHQMPTYETNDLNYKNSDLPYQVSTSSLNQVNDFQPVLDYFPYAQHQHNSYLKLSSFPKPISNSISNKVKKL